MCTHLSYLNNLYYTCDFIYIERIIFFFVFIKWL